LRRKDRQIEDIGQISSILDGCEVGHLALCADGVPYIVAVCYGAERDESGLHIYAHSAKEGKKIDMIASNPKACFEADRGFRLVGDLEGEACDLTAAYESVVAFGDICIVESEEEKLQGLAAILRHYGYAKEPDISAADMKRVAILRFDVAEITGKQNKA